MSPIDETETISIYQLRHVLDSLDSLICITDMHSGEVLFINNAVRERWGDIEGTTIQSGENGLCSCRIHDAALDSGSGPLAVSIREYFDPSAMRWYECRNRGIRWTKGRWASLQIAKDITEQKSADEAIKTSAEEYRLLIDNANDGIIVVQGGYLKFINKKMIEMGGGYSEEEFLTRPFPEFIHPDDRKMVTEKHSMRQTGSPVAEYIFRAITKRGEVRYLEVRGVPSIWQGSPAVLNFLNDVTARKKAEKALEISERKYEHIFENAQEGIFQSTPSGRFIAANPALARMYGYATPEDLIIGVNDIGRQLFVRQEKQGEFMRLLDEEGEVSNYELEFRRRDGTTVWISTNAHSIRDSWGKILYYEGTSVDITRRKKAEEFLRESLEKLRKATGGIIDVIVTAVETRDPYTAGHQKRVANLARAIAREMNLATKQVDGIRIGSVIHDVGKISVPAEILSKPTKLTEVEFNIVKNHSRIGYAMIKDIEFPWPVAKMILQHHERMNGSGYPLGITGDRIILEAKILSVADVVEAIASHRPYRPAFGIDAALEEIANNKGVLYDSDVVDACLALFHEKGFKLD